MNKSPLYHPLVSVVVITYNSSEYVIETLESVKGQTYDNIELIVSDDCSTDNTLSICKEWLNDNKNRFVNAKVITTPKNMGIAPNCNVGLSACKGEWVKFIAGDDALENNLVETYIHFASQVKDVKLICSNAREYNNFLTNENACPLTDTANFKFNQSEITAQDQFKILLRCNPIWTPTVMLKRVLLEKMGGFNEQHAFYEDRPLWLKLTQAGYKFHYLNIVSVKYRKHEGSIQVKKAKKAYVPRFEFIRDKILLEEYSRYLTFIERVCYKAIVFRHQLILKVFQNKRNVITKGITFFTYYLPNKILKKIIVKYNS